MDNIKWLQKGAILAIYDRIMAEFGGNYGVRSENLLESALDRAKNIYLYSKVNIAELAACYAILITNNHPFVDGNKRMALVTCELFLRINGMVLHDSQENKYIWFKNLAAKEIAEKEFTDWIKSRAKVS